MCEHSSVGYILMLSKFCHQIERYSASLYTNKDHKVLAFKWQSLHQHTQTSNITMTHLYASVNTCNHCHQSVTAGYLTNQLKTPLYNQATFTHNTQKGLNKVPSQPLICQSSRHMLCCSRREWRLHPFLSSASFSQHWGLIITEQKGAEHHSHCAKNSNTF